MQPGRKRQLQPTPIPLRVAAVLALVASCGLVGLRINLTGSLPVGLYSITKGIPGRDALVLVCLPNAVASFAKRRGYVAQGGACPEGLVPVGKRVCAVPGDTVTVTPTGLIVNETLVPNSQALSADHRGRPLPQLPMGRYLLGPHDWWVLSPYSASSFDSRYFGAIDGTRVQACLKPLWTRPSVASACGVLPPWATRTVVESEPEERAHAPLSPRRPGNPVPTALRAQDRRCGTLGGQR